MLSEVGPVEIEVPRDRDGSFDPVIVRKRQRRLDGIDALVLSLTARGLTTGEMAAHFAEVYGAKVAKDTISRITDKVIEEMSAWQARPLDRVYPVVFVDAIVVKIRDGQVTNRPVYVAIGVTVNGERDILGLWAGDGSEGAKFWLAVEAALNSEGFVSRTSYLINLSSTPENTQLTISVHTPTEAITADGVPDLPAVQVMRALANALESVEAGRRDNH